jgi:transposase InsO family protein
MIEGGHEAVRADEGVVAASEVRRLEERVRELERQLGRKSEELEILKEALDLARAKKPTLLSRSPRPEDFAAKTVASTLRVARWNIIARNDGSRPKRGAQIRAGDVEPAADIAIALNLEPCFMPVESPESNGMAEAFVKTFKRDYVRVNPLPDAVTSLAQIDTWIEADNI